MQEMMKASLPWSDGMRARDDPHKELAITVIRIAVDDYIKVLKNFMKDPDKQTDPVMLAKKQELERFFRSENYEFYAAFMETEVDPEVLIKQCHLRAKERLEAEKRKNRKSAACVHQ